MSSQLELAGAMIRRVVVDIDAEFQFVVEIYTPRRDRTLEVLACTSSRDLHQWIDAFREIMTMGGTTFACSQAFND